MKKQLTTKTILAVVILMAAFTSCQKATVNYFQPVVSPELPRVKTIDYGSVVRTNEYDGQGRVVQANYNTGAKTLVSYTGNSIISESFNPSGALLQKDINMLNSDGLIESATNSNNLPSVFYYSYNNDKKLINDTYLNNGVLKRERFYTYSNGNLVKDSTAEGSSWYCNDYEYFIDILSTIESVNFGSPYYGAGNKNVVKKVTSRQSDGVVKTKIYSLPEKDAAGRVTKTS